MSDNRFISIELKINGRKYRRSIQARLLLADFIRHEIGLKGTHVGCEHGVCGACTVLLDGRTARSCLHFAVAVQSCEITTIEGVSDAKSLSKIQQAFKIHHALQCGFCTPGFILTATELFSSRPNASKMEIEEALTNNVCRCTGYTNISRAFDAIAKASAPEHKREDA